MFAWRWNLQHFVASTHHQDGLLNDIISEENSSYWTCRLLLRLVFKIRPGFYCGVVMYPYCVCVCERGRACMRWECVSGINNGVKEQQSQKRTCFSGEVSCKIIHMWLFMLFVWVYLCICACWLCVCVYILMYWCKNLCQGCCIQTDRTGLMDFIDFLSLYNEPQGLRCVEGKGGKRRLWETIRNKRSSNKQPDKAAFIVNPLIKYVHPC